MFNPCDPMDCGPPGSSIHGIFQARRLECVAIFSSRGIFPTQKSNPCLLCLLQVDSFTTEPLRSPRGYLQLLYSQTSKVGSSHDVIGLLCSVAQSCPTLCDPMNHSTPGLPVHHQLPESTQTHVHRVGDAIKPSHPLLSPSPPALNLSQHQGLFQ